jgi:hypothetical protein
VRLNEDDFASNERVGLVRGSVESVRVVEEADMRGSEVGSEVDEVRIGVDEEFGAEFAEGEDGRTTERGRRGPFEGSVLGRE